VREFSPTWGDVTLEIIAEKGVIRVDAFNQKLNVYNDTARKAEWAYWGGNPDLGLVRDFCMAVDQRREPSVTVSTVSEPSKSPSAAYKSVETGKVVRV